MTWASWSRAGLTVAALAVTVGCGYRPANSVDDPLGPFDVIPVPGTVAYSTTIAAAAAGARAELSRVGQLGCSSEARRRGCASIEVEVVLVEEVGVGIVAREARGGRGPIARGLRVSVTGRARLVVDGRPERATGDVTTAEVVARADDAVGASLGRDDAARAAATRLGERLVRLLFGRPEPSTE